MNQPPSEKDKHRFKKAMKALEGGNPSEAIKLFSKVRKSWGENADIYYLEGLAYGKLGKFSDVTRTSKKALKIDPKHFGAMTNLANALIVMRDYASAISYYEKALKIKPNAPETMDNYGRALSIIGRRDESIEVFTRSLQVNANHAPTHAALGKVYAESGQIEKAKSEFDIALGIDINLPAAHIGKGILSSGSGALEQAEFHFNKVIELDKINFEAYIGLANVKRYSAEYDTGLSYIKKAEKLLPDDKSILSLKAHLLEQKGDKEDAYKIVEKLILNDVVSAQAVTVFLKLCRSYDRCDEAIELIEQTLERTDVVGIDKQALLYAAGDLLDKLKRYDEAMSYYQKANVVVDISCNREAHARYHDDIIKCFSKAALKDMPRAKTGSSRPVFVLGMPRSGTTLTEQILSSHSDVFGAGELHYIKQLENSIRGVERGVKEEYISRINSLDEKKLTEHARTYLDKINALDNKARYVIDKMPNNFIQIGLISLLFPEARIIHCQRNPLDNCLSIYFQSFIWLHDYAVDLSDIGFYYNEHERLMKHWKEVIDIPIMTVQYEDVLQDQEAMSRKLLDFCDLEWDESVMSFHKTKRSVATASYDQVRQPIYQSSKERWRNYEKYIDPLKDELNFSDESLMRMRD